MALLQFSQAKDEEKLEANLLDHRAPIDPKKEILSYAETYIRELQEKVGKTKNSTDCQVQIKGGNLKKA